MQNLDGVRVVWSSGESFLASYGNVVISRWAGAPSAAQLRRLSDYCSSVAAEHGGAALLDIVTPGRPFFDDEARREALALTRKDAVGNLGVAHVVLIPGLANIAVRGVLLAILALSAPAAPTSTFEAIGPAASWLAPLVGMNAGSLERAAQELVDVFERVPHAARVAGLT
jgi:hypothetical protein